MMRTPIRSRPAPRKGSAAVELWTATIHSEIGPLVMVTDSVALCALDFGDCEERMNQLLSRRFERFELHREDPLRAGGKVEA
jgi:hypothetical protein